MSFWESLGSGLIGGLLAPFGQAASEGVLGAIGLGSDKPKQIAPPQMRETPQIGVQRRQMMPPQMPQEV
ncbi:MAG: hypothetical protein WC789_10615 [Lentisphaeria bacterium]